MDLSNLKNSKVLILAPHTDDGEFGCGGSIARFVREGNEIFYVAFSACEQSVLPHLPKDILISEVKEATSVLGIKSKNLILHKFNVRTFNFNRQEILEILIELRNDIEPDYVFIPSVNDIHQDHSTIANEAIRAFKFTNILSYEMPWNNFTFNTTAFITLNSNDIFKKIKALKKYKSQSHRPYANENFIKSLATVRGTQIGREYAEVFEIIRLII